MQKENEIHQDVCPLFDSKIPGSSSFEVHEGMVQQREEQQRSLVR